MRKCQTCRFSQDRFQLFFGVESFLKRFKRKCSIGKVKKNGWMHLIDGNQTTGEVEGVKLIFGSRKRRSKHTTSSSTTFLKSWFFEGDYALRHESKYGLLHTISGGVLERKEKKKLAKILICINWEAFFGSHQCQQLNSLRPLWNGTWIKANPSGAIESVTTNTTSEFPIKILTYLSMNSWNFLRTFPFFHTVTKHK